MDKGIGRYLGIGATVELGFDCHARRYVRVGSPADAAKLAPGEKVLAVNGNVYSSDDMKGAVRATKTGGPLNLIVQNNTHVRTVGIDYHDGERYPHLERIDGTPDYLDEFTKPLTSEPPAEKEKPESGQ